MYNINETQLVDEECLEVKIVPLPGVYLIQVSSESIRGTLVLVNDIEENELVDFSKALHVMIQHFEVGLNHEGEVGS